MKNNYEGLNNEHEVEEIKKTQLKRRKASKLFREILFNSMFLWILFVVSYSNKDINSYNYKKSIPGLFLDGFDEVFIHFTNFIGLNKYQIFQTKIATTNGIWSWIKEKLVHQIKNNGFYKSANSFARDHSSILMSYPIIRQNRIKNGIF